MYTSTFRVIKNAALAIFASGTLCPLNAVAQQKSADNSILSIERNSIDNTPKSITFSPSAGWRDGQAQDIFTKYLGINPATTKMVLKYRTTTKSGLTSERYVQYYKGYKVEHGTYVLTMKNGLVPFVSGNYYNTDADIPATATLTESAAFSKALAFVHADKYMWQDAKAEQFIKSKYHKSDTSYLPHGSLEWIEDFTTGEGDRKLHLAYAFDIFAKTPVSHKVVFVDAQNGKILHSNSLINHTAATGHSLYSQAVPIQTALVGGTYIMYDSTRGNGVYTVNAQNAMDYSYVDFSSGANTWPPTSSDSQAVDAQWGAEMVYDYWSTQQGRLSWDGMNGQLDQFVHWDVSYDNAYWDGSEMVYGDGSGCDGSGEHFNPLTSLDVTGHEIGHGVCQATADLAYVGESGGMNEGFSDCWGATIENWANPHEIDAVAKQPWKIGEEIGCGDPLRSMDAPELQNQPSVYHEPGYWIDSVAGCPTDLTADACGVHTNSGVLNHWYYLVTMGGSGINAVGTTYSVNAIGWTEAPQILYATELALSPTSHYADARTQSINVATSLFGPCSPEVQSVTNAWYAVGIGSAFVPCTPQVGFVLTALDTTEYAATTTCPASKVITIGLNATGPAITGGSATVNVVVGHGTAVPGVDYTLTASPMVFTAGDLSTHTCTLTLFDNGAVNDSKNLVLGFTLAAGASDASISATNDSMYINIVNDDKTPDLGGAEYHTLTYATIADSALSNNTSAFRCMSKRGRTQFILYASELTAAGVRPNVPISQVGFHVLVKASTAPFLNYTVSMGNTTATDLGTAFVTGLTTVYTGSYTTFVGLDTIAFSTPFTWNGTSNVIMQVCFGANASTFGTSDEMAGVSSAVTVCDYATSNTGTGAGCALAYSTSGQNTAHPVMRFKQIVPPSAIETALASTRTWDVHSGTQVYFYNPVDTNLIASLNNETNDLGCVSATVTGAGVGFTPAVFSSMNRSSKEVTITPAINGAATTYDATIYMTNTELNSVAPSTLYLLKTDAATDAAVNASNSVIVTPSLTTGTNYVGFTGHFTGFSRFFLVDQPILCTPPVATITPTGPTTFCLGGNVTLNANTDASYTYQWQDSSVNIPGATNASYIAIHAGAYTVVVSQLACAGTSTITPVAVDSAYTAPITGAASVCTGQTATLTDVTGSGTWHSTDDTKATVSTSGVLTGVNAGSVVISYTATNPCGSATQTRTITVNASPVVAPITGTLSTCANTSAILNDVTPSGTWSSSNTAVATVVGGTVSGAGTSGGTDTVSYSVTNAAGCTVSATASVTIFALPPAVITPVGSTTFCVGSYVTLNTSTGAGLSYQWQAGGANIAGATTASYNADTTGDYTVVVTNTNSCTVTSAVTPALESGSFIVVPAVAIAAAPGILVCTGSGAVNYTATPVNGGPTPTYQWSVDGFAATTGSTMSYTPADGDIVSVVMTSDATCASPVTGATSIVMTVSAYVNPSVSIHVVPSDTACTGVASTFEAVPVYGGTAPAYVWNKNGINIAAGSTYSYAPLSGDVITCIMSSDFVCRLQDTAVSSPMTMVVEAPVSNTVTISSSSTSVISGQPVTFTAAAPNGGSSPVYQWFINGLPVAGAAAAAYTTDTLIDGQVVTCEVTSSEACATPHTSMSSGVVILVTTGVKEVTHTGNTFTLMPNPNNGTFIIKGSVSSADDNVGIRVTDVLGQEVYSNTVQAYNGAITQQVTLNGSVASGMYIVNITSAAGSMVYHVVVEK